MRGREGFRGFLVAAIAGLGALALPAVAAAHGGMTDPPQRQVVCRFLDRDSEPCAAAWRTNPQALYDWMEVNLGDVAGRHRERIPDGGLCSAGREKYAAFDRPSLAWPAALLKPGAQTLTYDASPAAHATRYYRLFLTREGFDPTQPLRWDDLEQIYDSGRRPAERIARFRVTVPERTGRHILYVVWQRSDSPEAFYGCSDVTFDPAQATLPAGPVSVSEATQAPPPSAHAHHEPAGGPAVTTGKGVRAVRRVTSDWGQGYCATVTVTNRGRARVAWRATVAAGGRIDSLWDATGTQASGRLTARGKAYNRVLAAGARTTFGFCATR